MNKFKSVTVIVLVLAVTICTVDSLRYILPRRCTTSSQCGRNSCCRTSTGIVDQQEGVHVIEPVTGGTCGRLSRLGEECIPGSCGCVRGTSCYSPIQGVCCPVSRCYEAKWVKEQKEYWDKCFRGEIICHLPPASNPGGTPSLQS